MRKIGIFGGSFDPIHFGHLRSALEILEALSLDEIRFIPSGQPPHRQSPAAGANLRLQMLKAATAAEPRFVVDEREIKRSALSYTVDTLVELQHEYPDDRLALMVGMDAFLGFTGWHRWRKIFDYAHVIAAHRPGWVLQSGGELVEVIHQRQATSISEFWSTASGHILLQPVTQLEISSTLVRTSVAAGGDARYLVPEVVRELILNSNCYRQSMEH
jgi:nicotinate-nucleotide adenylyltransferase